jgi:peptide/nickel transport system permease protein
VTLVSIDPPNGPGGLALQAAPMVADPPATETGRPTRRQRSRLLIGELLRRKMFLIGAAILLFWIVDAIGWRLLAPQDPFASHVTETLQGPSSAHWFGTDWLGRDVFSRVLAGSTSVLLIAPAATLVAIVGGTTIGLVTGYYRGAADNIMMRLVEAVMAFPHVIIAVVVLALVGSSTPTVILVLGLMFIPPVSRTVRSAVLSERERDYVPAARLRGERGWYVMAVEILPNITGPIAVEATIRLAYSIFTSATLSFLSLGVQQPSPDWGLSIALGRVYVATAPWIVLFPALALATLVIAVNLVADALKQVVEEP